MINDTNLLAHLNRWKTSSRALKTPLLNHGARFGALLVADLCLLAASTAQATTNTWWPGLLKRPGGRGPLPTGRRSARRGSTGVFSVLWMRFSSDSGEPGG